jgi:hypothetical protein
MARPANACVRRAISQEQESRSPSPRSPSPRGRRRSSRGRSPSPAAPAVVEKVDAQVSVRRRTPRRSGATPARASDRGSFGSPSLLPLVSFQRQDTPGRPGAVDEDSDEDLPTVRDSPEPQQPISRRRPRGSGERAAERKSIRKAMPKPPGIGIVTHTTPVGGAGRGFSGGLTGWRVWAWAGAVLVILLCKSLGSAARVPVHLTVSDDGGSLTQLGRVIRVARLVHSDDEDMPFARAPGRMEQGPPPAPLAVAPVLRTNCTRTQRVPKHVLD